MSGKEKLAFIEDKSLKAFISRLLQEEYDVIAPVKRDDIRVFSKISSFEEINQDFVNTTYPAKKYFIPHKEDAFEYDGEKMEVSYEDSNRIIFGIRPCDVHAIKHHDKIFLEGDFVDPYYKKNRENTLIFSVRCIESGENCFCTSLGTDKLDDGFDLLFSKVSEGYVVEIGSEKGREMVLKNKDIFTETCGKESEIKEVKCEKKLSAEEIDKLDEKSFNSEVWQKHAENCLSCCSCTITCPNCTCFGFRDVINMDLKSGRRIREWQSCQLKVFTQVAGGHVFRSEREKRLKHRIYHQLSYFKKNHGEHLCVGCGRCISNCPTRIDMTEIIKEL